MATRETRHGVTPREAEMLARHERGESLDDIAAAMGLSIGTVTKVVRYYNSGLNQNGAHEKAMAMGSQSLLRAIQTARAM